MTKSLKIKNKKEEGEKNKNTNNIKEEYVDLFPGHREMKILPSCPTNIYTTRIRVIIP